MGKILKVFYMTDVKYILQIAEVSELEALEKIIKAEDVLENYFMTGQSVTFVLQRLFEMSKSPQRKLEILSLYRDDGGVCELVGMGGVLEDCVKDKQKEIISSGKNRFAQIWFMGEDMERHARFLVKHGSDIVNSYLKKYACLYNVVGIWNKQSIRFLKRLGFKVSKEAQVIGYKKALFYPFFKQRENLQQKDILCVL